MKKLFLNFALVLLSASFVFTSCDDDKNKDDNKGNDSNEVILKSEIKGIRNLVKDSVYILQGQINVSGTINIAAGTVIKGDKVTKGCMVIVPGGKINAIGTATSPIVFTSRLEPGLRAAGDWGGLVICGKAPINQSTATVEGLTNTVTYSGGTNPADNSGTLQYVRIEFAGIALEPDKEINGLTLCGVGSGTTIDHIQVSYSGDDSFEFFGGKVNAKYLIAYCGLDDDFDTDFGYSGNLQFGLGVRNPRTADVSASNGFESDNDASGTTAQPKTKAVFSNFTLIGPYKTTADKNVSSNFGAGMHIRRNSSISVFNSVIAGWNTAGLLLDGSATYANAKDSLTLSIQNSAIIGTKVIAVKGDGTAVTNDQASAFFNTAAYGNLLIADNATAKISNSFYNAAGTGTAAIPTSFLPEAGSALLSGALYTHAKLNNSFFDKTGSFIGAFGTTDWTKQAWVNFDPQNTVY
jgi:hypothetical protein